MIFTKRLILREFEEKDFDDFAALMANEEVMRFSLKGPLTKEEAREYFQKRILDIYQEYGFGLWALLFKKDHKLIGLVGLIPQIIDEKKEIELGFRLHSDYWGQGLASEAAKAVCIYAKNKLGIKRLISIIEPENKRSVKVAEKLGMKIFKKTFFKGFFVQIYEIILAQ